MTDRTTTRTDDPDNPAGLPATSGHVPAALATALAYHEAWTAGDVDRAMTLVAEDVVCRAPAGRLEGVEAFRAFMGPFVQILRTARLVGAFGDDSTAVVLYDTETVPVADAPGAEWVAVRDGRIVQMRIIFDRLPFEAARRAAAGSEPPGRD